MKWHSRPKSKHCSLQLDIVAFVEFCDSRLFSFDQSEWFRPTEAFYENTNKRPKFVPIACSWNPFCVEIHYATWIFHGIFNRILDKAIRGWWELGRGFISIHISHNTGGLTDLREEKASRMGVVFAHTPASSSSAYGSMLCSIHDK